MAADLKQNLVAFANSCVQDTKFQEILNLETIHENTKDEKSLLGKIEELESFIRMMDEMIPYIQLSLSITAQSSLLTQKLSNARLLQASNALNSSTPLVGPSFRVKLYTLFAASMRSKTVADWTWKEEYALASAIIKRTHPSTSKIFGYRLEITQDFDDGRYHEETDQRSSSSILISDIHRLYYSNSGRLLNIQDAASSVLVFKIQRSPEYSSSPTIPKMDDAVVEWIAIEMISPSQESDGDSDSDADLPETPYQTPLKNRQQQQQQQQHPEISHPLSLLEYAIRLCSLEEHLQIEHFKADDDTLAMYLANDADYETVGDDFGGRQGLDRPPSHDVKDSPFRIKKTPMKAKGVRS